MGKMQFNALIMGSHTVVMDAPERVGGEDLGPIPKPLFLTSLAGCTGMDVVAILRNRNKPLERFEVRVAGTVSNDRPIQYTGIHVVYDMHGDAGHEEEALKAVERSQRDLCGVSAMIKRSLPVTWEVRFNGAVRFSNAVPENVGAAEA